MERKEIKLNMFLGETHDGEYVFIEEAFDNGSFTGLTYNAFEFKTERQKEYDEDNYFDSTDDTEYMFCEYIKRSHDWDCTVNEWIEKIKDEYPNGACYDDSYCGEDWLLDVMKEASEKDGYDYEYSNCVSCGRLGKDAAYSKRDYYEYVNEENWEKFQKLLAEYEK